jgi:hypothetical protein
MDQYATRIDDLPDNGEQMFQNNNFEKKQMIEFNPDENINLKIKKENKGIFSSIYSAYFNEEALLLVLLLVIRTFHINSLFSYIPLINSIIPENGFFATIITSVLLAFVYITIIRFK